MKNIFLLAALLLSLNGIGQQDIVTGNNSNRNVTGSGVPNSLLLFSSNDATIFLSSFAPLRLGCVSNCRSAKWLVRHQPRPKNLLVIGRVGYYKQRFNIQRPFQYRTPDGSEPLVSTEKCSYNNIHFLLGVGYQKNINEKWALTGQLSYDMYNTCKQKYEQGYAPGKTRFIKKTSYREI